MCARVNEWVPCKEAWVKVAGVGTKTCTQNHHELLKAAALDGKLYCGHRRVFNTWNRFGGRRSGRMM